MDNSASLNDRIILILGGSSGIGLSTAQLADEQGARVVIASRGESRRKEALAGLSDRAADAYVDLSQLETIKALIESYDRIDHLVFLPAAGGLKPLSSLQEDEVRAHFDHSFFAAWQTIKTAVPRIGKGGSITLITGALSRRVRPDCSHIVAAQWATEGLMRSLIREVAPVRINMIAPGLVDTPFWDALGPDDKAALFESTGKDIPSGAPAKPEEIAAMILSAMTNPFMNGATVVQDGGWSL
ncbi:MAG: SDR family oxidoreductase [Verrucomicrobiota bacterium]